MPKFSGVARSSSELDLNLTLSCSVLSNAGVVCSDTETSSLITEVDKVDDELAMASAFIFFSSSIFLELGETKSCWS